MGTLENCDFRSLMDIAKQNSAKVSTKNVPAKPKIPSGAVKPLVRKPESRPVPVFISVLIY